MEEFPENLLNKKNIHVTATEKKAQSLPEGHPGFVRFNEIDRQINDKENTIKQKLAKIIELKKSIIDNYMDNTDNDEGIDDIGIPTNEDEFDNYINDISKVVGSEGSELPTNIDDLDKYIDNSNSTPNEESDNLTLSEKILLIKSLVKEVGNLNDEIMKLESEKDLLIEQN